jgi:hypothetical protein
MRKVLQQLFFISGVALFLIACEKGEESFPPVTPVEKTLVYLPDAAVDPLKTIALDLNPGVLTLDVLEVRRDAKTAAELNKAQVVKIKLQNAAIADPSSGEINELPRNLYTNHPENPFDGQYWTVTFQPGEWKKFLRIMLDPSTLITLTTRVGLGFQIAEAPNAQISDSRFQLGVEISAKNQWDGVYRLTWTNYHPTLNTAYTGSTTDIEMRTTGANKVKLFWPLANAYCTPSILGGGLSYFLLQEPEYTVNTSTNAVTVQNAAPGAVTFYTMATGFNSRYEPASKTFYAKWGYSYAVPGVFDPNCREWTQTFVYLRPR